MRLALLALVAAAAVWLLPAWDAELPGGSIVWQAGAVTIAVVAAVRTRRVAPEPRAPATFGQVIAVVALLGAAAWLAGIAILWLIWPR